MKTKTKKPKVETKKMKRLRERAARWFLEMVLDGKRVIDYKGFFFVEWPGFTTWDMQVLFDIRGLAQRWYIERPKITSMAFLQATDEHRTAVLEAAKLFARPVQWPLYITMEEFLDYMQWEYKDCHVGDYLNHCAGVDCGVFDRIVKTASCDDPACEVIDDASITFATRPD